MKKLIILSLLTISTSVLACKDANSAVSCKAKSADKAQCEMSLKTNKSPEIAQNNGGGCRVPELCNQEDKTTKTAKTFN